MRLTRLPLLRRQPTRFLLLPALLACLAAGSGRAADQTAEGKTVELPKLTVTDKAGLAEIFRRQSKA